MKRPTKEQLSVDVASDLTWQEMAEKYGYTDSRFLRKLSKRYNLPQRRVYRKPPPDVLQKLIQDDGLTPYEIADKLGYAEGGWSNIYKYCREYGIRFDFRPNADLYNRPFSAQQKAFVFGTLLGDGSLVSRHNGNNVVLKIGHSHKQLQYLEWKKELLAPYVLADIAKRNCIHPGGGSSVLCMFPTITHPWLVEIHPLLYPNRVKTVSAEWLDNINEFALAVWFMDDGSLNKRYGTMMFSTMSFTYEEHLLLQEWFNSRWDINTVIEPRRKNQFALRVNASVAGKLREIISPFVPSFMKHKVVYRS